MFRCAAVGLGFLIALIPLGSWAASPKSFPTKTPSRTTIAHKASGASKAPGGIKPGLKHTTTGKVAAKMTPPANPNEFIQYYNQGRQDYNNQLFAQAEKQLKKSLALAELVYAKRPENLQRKNLATVSHLVGLNAYKLKKNTDAALYLKKAMAIYNQPEYQLENRESVMGEALILAQMAMYDGRFQEAETYYKIALPLVEKKFGPDHQQTTQTRQILAEISQIDYLPDYLPALGTKVTHWTVPGQPIAVYITDGSAILGWKPEDKTVVQGAYAEWQKAMENKVQFEFVDDPQRADTVVSWMDRPMENTDQGHQAQPELRNGICQTKVRDDKLMTDDIVVAVNNTDGVPYLPNSLHNTLLHEIGHSIGLLGGHSTNPSDVMFHSNQYDDGRLKNLTVRDINSARRLYSLAPNVTNPIGIHLVAFGQYSALVTQGSEAFNTKNFQLSYALFKNALALYSQEPDTRFWLGLSAYQLKAYQESLPYLLGVASVPGKYQDEALKMVGYALIKSGEEDDKSGAYPVAEQKYQRAYQILIQGTQQIAVKPENSKAIQAELNWINQRLAMRSTSSIQWTTATPVNSSANSAVASSGPQPESVKKKLKDWFLGPDNNSNQVRIPIMVPRSMMGY
jgi:tetratricopeptide (TPR) repeat protein